VTFVKQMKQQIKSVPKEAGGDKGVYTSDNIDNPKSLGIRHVCIPKIGRPTPQERRHEKKRWFTRLQNFRCGVDASIRMLKPQFPSVGRLYEGSPRGAK
jgi:transposase, IS5 family